MTTATSTPVPSHVKATSDLSSRATLLAAAFLLPLGLAWMEGVGEVTHIIVFSAPGLVFAGLAFWLQRPALLLTSGIVTALVTAVVIFVLYGGALTLDPLAAPEYVGSHLALAGAIMSLVAGVRAFLAARSGTRPDARPLRVVAVLLATLLAGGTFASALAAERAAATGAGGGFDLEADVVLEMETRDFEFVPADVVVRAGDLVEIRVKNADRALHTFSYQNNGRVYEHDLFGQETTSFLVRFSEPGEVEVWCRPHSSVDADAHHTGMVATLRVV